MEKGQQRIPSQANGASSITALDPGSCLGGYQVYTQQRLNLLDQNLGLCSKAVNATGSLITGFPVRGELLQSVVGGSASSKTPPNLGQMVARFDPRESCACVRATTLPFLGGAP